MKRCARCGQTKETADFPRDRSCNDGYGYTCKACSREHCKAYSLRLKNRSPEELDADRATEQQCRVCAKVLLASCFYPDAGRKRCITERCIECIKASVAATQKRNSARSYIATPAEKHCNACGVDKPSTEFSPNRSVKDGLQAECKVCMCNRAKAYHQENLDDCRAAMRQRARENKAERAAAKKAWMKAHPEKRSAYHRKREALIAHTPKSMLATAEQVRTLLARFNTRCAYCGTSGHELEIDHIVPLTKGGLHSLPNMIPACKGCNSGKRDLDVRVFIARYFTKDNEHGQRREDRCRSAAA